MGLEAVVWITVEGGRIVEFCKRGTWVFRESETKMCIRSSTCFDKFVRKFFSIAGTNRRRAFAKSSTYKIKEMDDFSFSGKRMIISFTR